MLTTIFCKRGKLSTFVRARQLASRGRRRVRGAPTPDRAADLARQREVATAFLAAGATAVKHPAADLGRDDEPDEPVQEILARIRGRLAERDLCADWVESKPSHP